LRLKGPYQVLQSLPKSDNLLTAAITPGKAEFKETVYQRMEKDYAYKRRSGSHENLA
jgi:hypothetical protein